MTDKQEQPVSMEPVKLYFPTMLRKMWSGTEVQNWMDAQGGFYTATQLAAARQQGADEWMERAKDAEKCEDAYAKLIAELEKSNSQLLKALKQIQRTGYTDVGDWVMVDAAIKAAEVKP